MSLEKDLKDRSESRCELCSSDQDLSAFVVPPKVGGNADEAVMVCSNCNDQINDATHMKADHWRCLNDSMWNPNPAVQVVAYRMLHRLRGEGWPVDLMDMMYMEDETRAWAMDSNEMEPEGSAVIYKDSNGATLAAGDTVVLIKDLNVKGAGFTAKRGTAVRNISLVHDNAEHIEGKVNGQQIVIITQFVKKSS
ncbi:MAG: protein PhnA [Bacteroidia bacterium]|jgi:protein PhnA